ncbi:MAG TPA: amidohydrolase family protein, partial [Ochrobactrum sp.]|nr:amidohydrolase family protein [Ochrobactrum sp.]
MVSSGASKVIKGGTVITADRTFKADVLIEGEKIVAVGDNLTGDETIDASGCYIMPGGIDPHTHLQMPFMGTYSSDDFDTGTAAALAGGTTMVVDFVLPGPEGNLLDALQEWFQKAGKARTDYSFHMAITGWSERAFNEMPEVVKRGIN